MVHKPIFYITSVILLETWESNQLEKKDTLLIQLNGYKSAGISGFTFLLNKQIHVIFWIVDFTDLLTDPVWAR